MLLNHCNRGQLLPEHPFQVKDVALIVPSHSMGCIEVCDVQPTLGIEDGEEKIIVCLEKLLKLARHLERIFKQIRSVSLVKKIRDPIFDSLEQHS